MSNTIQYQTQQNAINVKDLVSFMIELLNIKSGTKLTLADMSQDLSTLKNLVAFKDYIKANLKNRKYEYLTGYQKFIEMFNDYKKREILPLEEKQSDNVAKFIKELFSRATDVMEVVSYKIQTEQVNFENFTTYEINFTDKQMKVRNEIGNKKETF